MKLSRFFVLPVVSACSLFLIDPAISAETVFTPDISDITTPDDLPYPGPVDVLAINLITRTGVGPCEVGDYSGCTLADVNKDIDGHDAFKPEIKVHFQADDFGDDGSVSNATLRLRGDSTRLTEQKSYRIKLDSKDNLWRGERKLQLNKHPYDLSRVSNKFSFDLMFPIPNLPSLRTQFVNLTIDDVPYGLFTHVENVGKAYLQRRGWDKDTPIYKAENTRFLMQDALKLDENGKPLDLDAFENIFEIKRGKQHFKLIDMLTAIGKTDNDFKKDVFDKYFNRNNYLTWLAVNILMGNHDTTERNFYLLNPVASDTFYFLPWDYDDSWGYYHQPKEVADGEHLAKWHNGLGTWWIQPLHRRYFLQPDAVNEIIRAVTEIKEKYFQVDVMQQKLDAYYPVIYPLISRTPDIDGLPVKANTSDEEILGEYNLVYRQIAALAEKNYQGFLAGIEDPMTFFLNRPVEKGTSVVFEWDASIDLQGDAVSYDFEVASRPDFSAESILYAAEGLTDTHYRLEWDNPNGRYFYHVIARQVDDPENHWQISPEFYVDPVTEQIYENVRAFDIKTAGEKAATPPVIPDTNNRDTVIGDAKDLVTSSGGGAYGPLGLFVLLFMRAIYRRQ